MSFQLIDGRINAEDYEPRVTIYKRGNLMLNHAAHKMIDNAKNVAVYFSEERNAFALEASNEDHAFALKEPQGRSSQVSLSFSRPLAAAKISLERSVHILPFLEEGKLLIPMNNTKEI